MNTSFDQVREMREDNYSNTEPPSIGGSVDYLYFGAYDGGDDVLGGILDKLLDGNIGYTGGNNNESVQTDGCETCSGSKYQEHGEKKSPTSEDIQVILTDGVCAYDDCPVDIDDDEDESLVVVSEPPANTYVGETEYEPDPDDDNSLVVVKKGSPLMIETENNEMLNKYPDKQTTQSISDEFFHGKYEDVPLVVNTSNIFSVKHSEKKGRWEVHDSKNNIKMEDYKTVVDYIKKYMETINKNVF